MSTETTHKSDDADGIVLYDTPGSPCARRVRTTLIEKGLPFRRVILDLAKMENKADWYLRINPNGQVPALRIGGLSLYESNVITEYLEARYPEPPLYPQDPEQYAAVKMWQTFEAVVSKHYGFLQYARLLGPLSRITHRYEDFMAQARQHTREPALLAWESRVWRGEVLTPEQEQAYEAALYQRLDELEQALTGRHYLVGERFSQAEISVYPRIAMYPYLRLEIAPQRYPNVRRWMSTLKERPAFASSLTLVDRLMSRPSSARLLAWADPRRQDAGPGERLLRSLVRRLLRQDVMRLQARLDRLRAAVRSSPAAMAPPPAPLAPPRAATPTAGPWTLYGCPFNAETRVAAACLLATATPFRFVPVLTPYGEEQGSAHRARAPLAEVPLIVSGTGAIAGWPYVLARIAERTGPSPLYPAEPYRRALTQIACAGDSVVNYKYRRPLYWQSVVGPWLRQRQASADDLQRRLHGNGADPASAEFVLAAYAGTLVGAEGRQACLRLLEVRARHLGGELRRHGRLCAADLTLGDLAEWARLEEALELGLVLNRAEPELDAVAQWHRELAGQPFASAWRRMFAELQGEADPRSRELPASSPALVPLPA